MKIILDKRVAGCYTYLVMEDNNEKFSLANTLYRWVTSFLGSGSGVDNPMKTSDAMAILERAGYRVTFTDGAWLVTLWEGCTERLNRKELVELAQVLDYVEAK